MAKYRLSADYGTQDEWILVREAAQLLGRSRQHVNDLAKRGVIVRRKYHGATGIYYMLSKESVLSYRDNTDRLHFLPTSHKDRVAAGL